MASAQAERTSAPPPEVEELRDYGVGAQILLDLGVRDMELLSNSATVLPGSGGYGLRIVGRRELV